VKRVRALCGWAASRRAGSKIALGAAVGLVVLAFLDALGARLANDLGRNQIAVAVLTEGVLLLVVYLLIDEVIERRVARAWAPAAEGTVLTLFVHATHTYDGLKSALADPASLERWEAFRQSAADYGAQVTRAQPVMTTTPQLAHVWNRYDEIRADFDYLSEFEPVRLDAQKDHESVAPVLGRLREAIGARKADVSVAAGGLVSS
jgi:hypothetical protein